MLTVKPDSDPAKRPRAFAVWITGLPSSGKSTIAERLVERLGASGVECARLESDVLREVIHGLDYTPSGRDAFYGTISWIAELLTDHRVPVVIDATANRRRYRERARQAIPDFVEVYVDTPLEVCMERDTKGVYRQGEGDGANEVPGLGVGYEPPRNPEITVSGIGKDPLESVNRIVALLLSHGFLPEG